MGFWSGMGVRTCALPICGRGKIGTRRKNGEVFPERMSLSAVKDAQGKVTHYVCMFTDISAEKAREAQLEFLAHRDMLTGLPNSRSEEHTSELQSQSNLVCRLLLEKKKLNVRAQPSYPTGTPRSCPSAGR